MEMGSNPLIILLVEDDDAHASILKRVLEKIGLDHSLVQVRDIRAALAYLLPEREEAQAERSEQRRPNLVLLGLHPPEVDGLEVLETMKQDPRTRRIPVIVCTTSSAAADIRRTRCAGADGYLVKPIDQGSFSALLRSMGLMQ